MKVWIDPPGGWRYGFPKLWNGHDNINEWLIREGYPKKEIESMGDRFYVRQWYDEDFNRQISEGPNQAAEGFD